MNKSALVVLLLGRASARVEADVSKAWAAAKDNLPANARAIGAIDVAAAVKTSTYAAIFAAISREEKDFAKAYEGIKQTCKMDPAQVIEGLIIAGDPDSERGILLVQHSIDRKKLGTCIQDVLRMIVGEPKATAKDDGAYITVAAGNDAVHFRWVNANVLAISFKPEKKAEYDTWLGGKGALAKSKLGEQVGKLDTKAIAWGAAAFDKPLDDNDLPVLTASGIVTHANKAFTLKLRGTMKDAKGAANVLAEMTKEIDRDLKKPRTPEPMKKLMRAIKIAATGADVTLDANMSETDLKAAIDSMK
jgi:hypothetical protein